jgi:uncharacterized protein DUF481
MNRIISILFFGLTIFLSKNIVAQKTDWVFLKNGNYLLCEIKQLEFGKLSIKADEMGTIKVEWDAIDSLWSEKDFAMRLQSGTLVLSKLDSSFYEYNNYEWEDIIELTQLNRRFWSQLEGKADVGLNYTKSSDVFQLNVHGSLSYRGLRNTSNLSISNITTIDNAKEAEGRALKKDLDLSNDYYFSRNILIRALIGFDQNTELGINARIFAGSGIGKEFLHSQNAWLILGAGARGNREWSTDQISDRYSIEGALSLEFKRFSYNTPKMDIGSSFTIFPSFTEWGRVRADLDIRADIEIIADFFLGVKFYYSLDNNPVDETAAKSDWGVTTSIGYNF